MPSKLEPWIVSALAAGLSLVSACDCGASHTRDDAQIADVDSSASLDATSTDAGSLSAIDASMCRAVPGRPIPESLGPCTAARAGEIVCDFVAGSGFQCSGGCWRAFWDDPCRPMRRDAAETLDDAGACPSPPGIDELSASCTPDGASCPPGYTCQRFSGAVLMYSCQILCEPGACPCPAGTACMERSDKVARWHECDPIGG